MVANRTLVYKKIPSGMPVPGQDLAVEDRSFDLDAPAPAGSLVVELLYASYDPYLRGRMRDPSVQSYSPAFEPGQPIVNDALARVLKTNVKDFKEGDVVRAFLPIAEYARIEGVDGQAEVRSQPAVRRIDNPYNLDLANFLGALGMPGLTAYSSLLKIGQPKEGETIFVSSAAGAVGQLVGQIAKRKGLMVIGSVGSDEKLEFITKELGYDAGFNYKKESPHDALKRLAPKGIDIYFENVGGDHLEAALENINVGGRIPVCGMISEYNKQDSEKRGIRGLFRLVQKQVLMQGFLVGNPAFGRAYYQEHQNNVQQWLHEGSFKAKLHVTEGIEHAAEGFVDMLQGKNFGKAVLKIKQ